MNEERDVTPMEIFEASLERCLAVPTFIQRFYATFVLRSDEVAERFRHTDMKRQERMLRHSLYMMLRAAQGADSGVEHLEQVAETHSRQGHDIPPHLYQHWVDCLLQVVSEVDLLFDEEVEAAWREGLRPAVQVMIDRHGG